MHRDVNLMEILVLLWFCDKKYELFAYFNSATFLTSHTRESDGYLHVNSVALKDNHTLVLVEKRTMVEKYVYTSL